MTHFVLGKNYKGILWLADCGQNFHIEIPQLGPKFLKIATFWKFLLNKMVKNSPLRTVKKSTLRIHKLENAKFF